jgi:hypothetical protein
MAILPEPILPAPPVEWPLEIEFTGRRSPGR